MRPYSPGGALNALATAQKPKTVPTPNAHRLQHGLPGYLILFAPHAFAPQRQYTAQRPAFATGVPPDICAFHRYTRNSSLPYSTLVMPVSPATPKLSPGISQTTQQTTYELFTPSNSGQRSHPTYYRGCWHVVSRCFLTKVPSPHPKKCGFVPNERSLQPEGRHPPRGVAASGLRPLCNIPHCCLP